MRSSVKIFNTFIIWFLIIFFGILTSCGTPKKVSTTATGSTPSTKNFYKKYSDILGVDLTGKENQTFIETLATWLGTPYVYGGSSKEGADCSGFVQAVYKSVYHISLYRTASDLQKNCDTVKKNNLKTGDLVFFKINSEKVSHVGIYLLNNKFIHASSSKGVVVSDLEETYYKKYFFAGGRIKDLKM